MQAAALTALLVARKVELLQDLLLVVYSVTIIGDGYSAVTSPHGYCSKRLSVLVICFAHQGC
jgi:hypothetical protein